MPRKQLIRSADFPYHIFNRSNNREFFYLDLESVWMIFNEVLQEVKTRYKCEHHAFVLMSNHYHLILSTPQSNLGEAMKYLHREVARLANKRAGRENHFFGGRYKWSLISDENYYWNALKYVFRNPVRAGICSTVEQYQFSSMHESDWLLTRSKDLSGEKIELDSDWLNEPFLAEQENAIGKALRRREFKLTRDRNSHLINLAAPQLKKGTVTF